MQGEKVMHPIFGEGKITKVEENPASNFRKYITVKFSSGNRKFIYPDAFESFLFAKNEAFREKTKETIALVKVLTPAKEIKMIFEDSTTPKKTDLCQTPQNSISTIKARTHAQFLNTLLDKNFKKYFKCGYKISPSRLIWMVRIHDDDPTLDWKNTMINPDLIVEKYTGESKGAILYPDHSIRYVFDVRADKNANCRHYVFLGEFKINSKESTDTVHIWNRVSTKSLFNGKVYEAL